MFPNPPFPPCPPYPRLPFPPRYRKTGAILSAAAVIAYGAWKAWQERKAKKQGTNPTAAPAPGAGAGSCGEGAPGRAEARECAAGTTPDQGAKSREATAPDEAYPFGSMESTDGGPIPLRSVSICGEVEGPRQGPGPARPG